MKRLTMFALTLALAGLFAQQSKEKAKWVEDRAMREYERALKLVDEKNYPEALGRLKGLTGQAGAQSDSVLYWQAYVQAKMAQKDAALQTLMNLRGQYSQSKWLEDASALEMELRSGMGQQPDPATSADDDMKLMALSALVHSDQERALPAIEKILKGTSSRKVKSRAMFVLAQSNTAKAREMLAQQAKAGNPDLQREALRMLSIHGGAENQKLLAEVYAANPEIGIKREIIRGYMVSGNKTRLNELARGETNVELRREAIRQLGVMGDKAALAELYRKETDAGVKQEIQQGLFIGGAVEALTEIAKTEKDPKLQQHAIRQLGLTGRAGDTLVEIYKSATDAGVKNAAIEGLALRGGAKQLVALAREEKDPEVKKRIVQRLSIMRSKEASDFMLELLNKE